MEYPSCLFFKKLLTASLISLLFLGVYLNKNILFKGNLINSSKNELTRLPFAFYDTSKELMNYYSSGLVNNYLKIGSLFRINKSDICQKSCFSENFISDINLNTLTDNKNYALAQVFSVKDTFNFSSSFVYKSVQNTISKTADKIYEFFPKPVVVFNNNLIKASTTNIKSSLVSNNPKIIYQYINSKNENSYSDLALKISNETDLKLQQLNNSIMSKFYNLSTGTGGNVTNIYQQIAHSQRIDSLSGTSISGASISGGTISGATISGGTLNVDNLNATSANLGTTTISNLSVSNTSTSTISGILDVFSLNVNSTISTSTFSNGIDISNGCFAVNGICMTLGGGGGSGTVNSSTAGYIGYFGSSGNVLSGTSTIFISPSSNIGLSTTSPFERLSVVGNIFATGNITGSNITATGTLSVTGNTTLSNATSTNFAITGLTSTLLKTNASGSVIPAIAGTDYLLSALTSIGPVNQTQTGSTITIATSTNITNGLTSSITVVGSGNTLTFTPSTFGTLSVSGGGTGASSFTSGEILYGTGTGALSSVATGTVSSSGGITTTANRYVVGGNLSIACDVASGSQSGCLSSTDWTAFNSKQNALSFTYPLTNSANNISLAFGTTTANTWSALQQFANSSSTILSAYTAYIGGTATTTFTNTGLVGIGTTTPFARLSINSLADEPAFVVGSSTATSFIVDSNGRVGVGTSTPSSGYQLSVSGDMYASGSGNFTGSISIRPSNFTYSISGNSNTLTFTGGHLGTFFRSRTGSLTTSSTSPNAMNFDTALTGSSGSGAALAITPTVTQSGTASYTALLVSVRESSFGSGARSLFELQTNTSVSTTTRFVVNSDGYTGIGTSTPTNQLTIASSTAPQLSLSAGAGLPQTVFRNDGTNLYISTTTVAGTSTTSISALEIALSGFGTTTVRGLNIIGQATSTSNVGFNITSGCFAINGNCINGGGSGLSFGKSFEINSSGYLAPTTSITVLFSNGFISNSSSTISSLNLSGTAINSILSTDSIGNVVSTSTPTFGFFNATSTNATSTIIGALQINKGLNISGGYIFGAGLSSCSGSSDKLIYNSTTGQFGCGTDAGAGGGLTSIGPVNQTQTGPTITIATSTNSTNGLTSSITVTGSANTLTFTPSVTGTLTSAGGGTGISSVSAAGVLLGNYAGTGWQQLATSSLGIAISDTVGTLGVSKGGTGATSFSYGLVYSPGGTSALANIATSSLGLLTTDVAEGSNLYYLDSRVNSYINSSSTIAKAYSANTFSALNTFNGGLTISTLNGPLQANNGSVSATTSIGVIYGGTGLTSAPSYGQLLVGNSSGGYTLTATSSLGLLSSALTSIGPVNQTTTGPAVTLATSTNSTNGLTSSITVTGSANTLTFTPSVTGTLTSAGGGTGISSVSAAGVLLGNYAGTGWQQLATSSLGIAISDTVGTLGVSKGGTGATSFSYGLVYSPGGTSALANIATSSLGLLTTDVAEGSNLYYLDSRVNSYINSSSTIAKAYSANTFSALNTFNGGLTISTLNGPLQANNGSVSATTSIGVIYGGTGLTSAPSYGQLLVGNSSGGYTLTATSSLGLLSSALTSIGPVNQTTTGPAVTLATSTTGTDFTITGSGSTLTFNIPTASALNRGLLSTSDFTTFTNKVSSSRAINTTYPIQGGGDLSADRTLTLAFGTTTANTWSALQQFTNSSSTILSAYTAYIGGTATTTFTNTGLVGIGTSTPFNQLTISSSTAAQLSLSDGAGIAQFTLRNAGGNLYFSTTTVAGTSTTSISALEIAGNGFGTTTVRGLNIIGQATSTSNVGFNITNGCFAVNGNCVGGGSASSTLLSDFNTFSNTNNFTGKIGLATSSPWAKLSVNSVADEPAFVVGSSTETSLIVDSLGNIGVNNTVQQGRVHIKAKSTDNSALVLDQGASANPWLIQFSRDGFSSAYVQLTAGNTLGWQATLNPYSDDDTYTIGTISRRWRSINIGTGDSQFDGKLTLNSYLAVSTTSPFAQVSINSLAGQSAFVVGSSTATSFIVNSVGNIGISTTSPFERLSVVGNIFATGNITGSNITATGTLSVTGNTTLSNSSSTILSAYTAYIGGTATTTFTNTGLVGIGTTTPFARLSINSLAGEPAFVVGSSTATSFIVDRNGNSGFGTSTPSTNYRISATGGIYSSGNVVVSGTLTTIGGSGTFSVNGNLFSMPIASQLRCSPGSSSNSCLLVTTLGSRTTTSGTVNNFILTDSFDASTGTADYSSFTLNNTINQGVAASGISRSIYINPIITRANDFRSFEIANTLITMRASIGQSYSGLFGQLIYASSTATTISTSTNITLFPPASGANVTTSTSTALYIQATSSTASSGVVQDAIGALIYAPSGGTRNSALYTVGANYMSGLTGSTGAGSLCLDSNNQVVYNSGTDACLPSLRETKNNIENLSVDAISIIENLNPVSFIYNQGDGRTRFGFIAEDTSLVNANLATYNAKGEISGIDDRAFLSVLVKGVKEIWDKVKPILAWFEGGKFNVKGDVCVDDVCISKDQFKAMLINANLGNTNSENPPPQDGGQSGGTPNTDTSSPIITINGDNPASIQVGQSYIDLGATVTDTDENGNVNNNLGIQFTVNGVSMTEISIDTSTTTSHTIVYSSIDAFGNTGYATRTVEVLGQ